MGLAVVWIFVALGAALVVVGLRGDRSRGRRRCPRCWHELGETDSRRCPECGHEARRERALHRSRRRWRVASLGAVLLLAAYVVRLGAEIRARGLAAALPSPVLVELVELEQSGFANGIVPPGATFMERAREALLVELRSRAWRDTAAGSAPAFDAWSRWRLGRRAFATDGEMAVRMRPTWPQGVPVSILVDPALARRRAPYSPLETRLEVAFSARGTHRVCESQVQFRAHDRSRILTLSCLEPQGPFTLRATRTAYMGFRNRTLLVQHDTRALEIVVTPDAMAPAPPAFDEALARGLVVVATWEWITVERGAGLSEDVLVEGRAELLRDGESVAQADGVFALGGRRAEWIWRDRHAVLAGASPEVGLPETHEWTAADGELMVSSLRGRWEVRLTGDLEAALIAELRAGARGGRWATRWWSGTLTVPVGEARPPRHPR